MAKTKPATKPQGRDSVPGFGEMIRTAREARGWSRDDLAGRAEVSRSGLADIELGLRSCSLRVASALVRALGIAVLLHDPVSPVNPTSG